MAAHALIEMIAQAHPVDVGGATQEAAQQSARLYTAVFYAVILLVIIAVGSYALLRMSRRYRERLQRKPDEPTPAPDVWTMHKTPRQTDLDQPGEEPDDEP